VHDIIFRDSGSLGSSFFDPSGWVPSFLRLYLVHNVPTRIVVA
jgi:hypothetical protein